ncbi:MAG: T9SS type B sorting domain-containing protein, partial [Flavobacteriales bacterium]
PITLTAEENYGVQFLYWEITSGAAVLTDATNPVWEVNLEGDITIAAHFGIPVPPEDIVFNIEPAGSGSIVLDGVLLSVYPSTETLTVSGHSLQAVSVNQWWEFSHWTSAPVVNTIDPDMNSANANLQVTLPGQVTAHFIYIEHTELEVEISPQGSGAVTIVNTTYVDDYWTSGLVVDEPLIFKASPADQWEFDRWEVLVTDPSPNERSLNMALDLEGVPYESVIAHFKEVDFRLYIPNAFTPDNDGVNDSFLPLGQGFTSEQYRFTVLNRWGEVVFDTTNPETPWIGQDNTMGGEHFVPDGVYMYSVTALGSHDPSSSTYRGYITIVR